MKKRVYALIPCLLILVLLAVFAGIRLKQQGNSSQTEYSIAIEDSTSTGSERPGTSFESRTSASKLTDSGTTTASTTASDAESTSKSAKTPKTKATSDTTAATTASASIDKNGWLETANLPNDSRTALMMAAAYIYNCVQNDPYKSSVFVRLATEALEREMKAAS